MCFRVHEKSYNMILLINEFINNPTIGCCRPTGSPLERSTLEEGLCQRFVLDNIEFHYTAGKAQSFAVHHHYLNPTSTNRILYPLFTLY